MRQGRYLRKLRIGQFESFQGALGYRRGSPFPRTWPWGDLGQGEYGQGYVFDEGVSWGVGSGPVGLCSWGSGLPFLGIH